MADPSNRELELTDQAKRAIRQYLMKLIGGAAAVLTAVNIVALVTIVPQLAASEVAKSEEVTRAQFSAVRAQFESLVGVGAATEQLRVASEQLKALQASLEEIDANVATLKKADQADLARKVEALNTLGKDALTVLQQIEKLRQDMPSRIVVTRTDHLGWGNRNTHQMFCSDRNQVMVAGAIGVSNLDFSPFCATLTLSK